MGSSGIVFAFSFFWDFFCIFLMFFVCVLINTSRLYTTKKNLTMTFSKLLGDERNFEPSRLMPRINRGGHFLLIEADKNKHILK